MMIKPQKSRAPILSLCWSDIKHEWMLNAILVVSIASIIAPLLILLGLKYGLIKYWTDTLIQDPVNRQITPKSLEAEKEFTDTWFKEYSQRGDIQFVVPMIRAASSNVGIQIGGKGKTHLLDVLPTKDGDALLLENGGRIPREGEGVITKGVADRFGVIKGQVLEIKLTRKVMGKHEVIIQPIKIVSVLSPRAGLLQRLYLPQQYVSDIEQYKDGIAVSSRGWYGVSSMPKFVMDGIYVVLKSPLEELDKSRLVIRTGFTRIEEIRPVEFNRLYAASVDEKHTVYKLGVQKNPTGMNSYRQIRKKLRGKSSILIPYVNEISLVEQDGSNLSFVALSLNNGDAADIGVPALPWGALSGKRTFEQISVGLFPTLNDNSKNYYDVSTILKNDKLLTFPMKPVGVSEQGVLVIPFELAGILRIGMKRNLVYDTQANTLSKARTGFYGFRMYAKTIDDVLKVEEDLREEGVYTNTEAESISRIKVIDSGLSKMFWLIAVVGIVGGLTSLIASFFASVKRKAKDLGILRLIGVSSSQMFRFPLYQALIISCTSVFLAIAAYGILAEVINRVFSKDLPLGQNLCYLPSEYLFAAGFITIFASLMSSLIAAYQTTKIDPSEAIRDD